MNFSLHGTAEALGPTGFIRLLGAHASLPPEIWNDEAGTWAYDTMTRRIRNEIMPRIFEDNKEALEGPGGAEAGRRLRHLHECLQKPAEAKLTLLPKDDESEAEEDTEVWNASLLASLVSRGCTWLHAPWLQSEFLFYRLVLSAFWRISRCYDPFARCKRRGLIDALPGLNALARAWASELEAVERAGGALARGCALEDKTGAFPSKALLRRAILRSLWGNQIDLSLWPEAAAAAAARSDHLSFPLCQKHPEENEGNSSAKLQEDEMDRLKFILANDFEELWNQKPWKRVLNAKHTPAGETQARSAGGPVLNLITDNSGYELFADLLLADAFLTCGLVDEIVFRLKGQPTFVSDATAADLLWTLDCLAAAGRPAQCGTGATEDLPKFAPLRHLADRWKLFFSQGRFRSAAANYWSQPLAFWDMPPGLLAEFEDQGALTIVKGDCNYRRLIGNRWWKNDDDFQLITSYFPTPVVALRTLKADVGCGMSATATANAARDDPKWMTNGRSVTQLQS
eukprot:GHVT01102031.1.p1 GENE.GHVT01102031.1~~GHVT01102031.1.p1  ORF type:complete len:513 (+),score=107.65 GHVT01102031.1:272-1810(+)